MAIWDDVWDKAEEAWNTVTGAAEDVVDAAEEEVVEAFWEWLEGAKQDYLEDGGKDVDPPDSEQYEGTGSTKSSLVAVDPTAFVVGTVDDIITQPDVWWAGIINEMLADAGAASDAAAAAGDPGVAEIYNALVASKTSTAAAIAGAPDAALPDLPGSPDANIATANTLADTLVWTDFNDSDPSTTIVELFDDPDLADLTKEPPPAGAYDSGLATEVAYVAPQWEGGAGSPHDASSTASISFLF